MSPYNIGARVAHVSYGNGTITRCDEYHTQIDFDAHGLRTFSTPRVQLTSITTAAPPKSPAPRKRRSPPANQAVER